MSAPVTILDMPRHGSPADRGSADAWYSRGPDPHYYEAAPWFSRKIVPPEMTPEQVAEYRAAYDAQFDTGETKDYR